MIRKQIPKYAVAMHPVSFEAKMLASALWNKVVKLDPKLPIIYEYARSLRYGGYKWGPSTFVNSGATLVGGKIISTLHKGCGKSFMTHRAV